MRLIASVAVLIILEDSSFLLQHRDDSPQIFFPGKIGLFGGEIEAGESASEAAIREIREELSIEILGPELVQVLCLDSEVNQRFRRRHYFLSKVTCEQSNQIRLREGQGIIRVFGGDLKYDSVAFVPYDLAFLLEFIGNFSREPN